MPLVDMVKKVDKARDALGLPANEQILMACTVNPRGTVGAAAVGGLVGAAIASRIDKKAREAAGDGTASTWPGGRSIMAITSERLVLCKVSALSGKPTEISAAWPHDEIAGIEVEKGRTAYPFSVVFRDGSAAQAEGAKGSGADRIGEVAAQIWT